MAFIFILGIVRVIRQQDISRNQSAANFSRLATTTNFRLSGKSPRKTLWGNRFFDSFPQHKQNYQRIMIALSANK